MINQNTNGTKLFKAVKTLISEHSLEELQDMKSEAITKSDSTEVSEIVNAVFDTAITCITSPDGFKTLGLIEHFASGVSASK